MNPCSGMGHAMCTLAGTAFAACPCSTDSLMPCQDATQVSWAAWLEQSRQVTLYIISCAACNKCWRHGGIPVAHHIRRHALLDGA